MNRYTQKYGKQLMSEILDIFMISHRTDEKLMYDLCLKHKLITRNTKSVYVDYRENTDGTYKLHVQNRSSKSLIHIYTLRGELKEIMEEINEVTIE